MVIPGAKRAGLNTESGSESGCAISRPNVLGIGDYLLGMMWATANESEHVGYVETSNLCTPNSLRFFG